MAMFNNDDIRKQTRHFVVHKHTTTNYRLQKSRGTGIAIATHQLYKTSIYGL